MISMTKTNTVSAAYIRHLIRLRRGRIDISGEFQLTNPVWDLLLDLTAARLEDREISMSGACIASNAPATTALRWIKKLIRDGVIERTPHPRNGQGATVRVSDRTHEMMLSHLSTGVETLSRIYENDKQNA